MAFDIERIEKATRTIVKFVRKNSKRPGSNAVHNLRTSIRTLETAFVTLELDSGGRVKRFLRDLGAVRKRAGRVRDMDVLIGAALTVNEKGEQDCLVQLLEYVGAQRDKHVQKLRGVVQERGSNLRRDLKRNFRRVEELLKEAESDPKSSDAIPLTMAKAISLSSDLSSPSRLTRNNLHSYRLKVKELRDTLQLSHRAGSSEFLEKLGEVKDAIGEWHDWEGLVEIATKAVDHGSSCRLIKRLKMVSKSKYDKALLLTERLRSHYLKKRRPSRHRANRSDSSIVTTSVIQTTSAIVGG